MREFSALSPETLAAAVRFERETGRWLVEEIEERDERMVRLFLILHGYHPGEAESAESFGRGQSSR